MKSTIQRALAEKIAELVSESPADVLPLLEEPKNRDHGDLSYPCFTVAKRWREAPPKCAERLREQLELPSGIESATVVGPFLNFRFARAGYTLGVIRPLLAEDGELDLTALSGRTNPGSIVIDYSSPNIAKPFHVGHLRATLIGNALQRIYRRTGHRVTTVNHLGDWGTQFGFVWAGCQLWGKPAEASVTELVELYRKATGLKDAQENGTVPAEHGELPDVNAMAREFFIDLEAGKPYAVEFWRWNLDISLAYLKRTYARLGVTFDHYTGESFYSDRLDDTRKDLEQSGVLVQSQGAWGVDLGEKLGFARVLAPDGRSLYLTRDIATAQYRADTYHFDKALYVVGAPQSLHFQQLRAVLEAMKKPYAAGIEHVAFGHVMGMKTRGAGETIELNEFLDEAYERALDAYREQVTKRPEGLDENEVAEAVALSAIVFSTLSRSRMKDVHFSWDHALEFQGDSGPYLLYAYARINGIFERAAEAQITPGLPAEASTVLSEERAYQLAHALDALPATLERVIAENEPSHLATYGLDVAHEFSRAYNDLKVLGESDAERRSARLALFAATKRVLGTVIDLLGMKRLERM